MKLKKYLVAFCLLLLSPLSSPAQNNQNTISDKDIVDAYHYFLGRLLVLRQEHIDFKDGGFKWNEIYHREPGGVAWANPNLDVVYSEAWLALDSKTCVLVDIPKIEKRYYTFQVLNSWGETLSNINERAFPRHPYGKFAYCQENAAVKIPTGTERINVVGNKFRVLARVEIGKNQKEAVRLQKQIKIRPTATAQVETPVQIPLFSNKELPGSVAFEKAEAILKSEPDTNDGMVPLQEKTLLISRNLGDEAFRARTDEVIRKEAIPSFLRALLTEGTHKNGWGATPPAGKYGSNYLWRSLVNYGGIWANTSDEVVYYRTNTDGTNTPLNGSETYTMTFPADQLPETLAKFFWSVIVVDGQKFMVVPNSLNRYLINNQSKLQKNKDGSLTIVFANKQPKNYPQANWLPTPDKSNYHLTFRFYGPELPVVKGQYFPPPLQKVTTSLSKNEL
ncbi:DUF1214 domain-containing protein [Bdellovibrio sp. HCB117]|uniref:DUF1214 domain-containing protein n=1 Tax=Bdellovibrio sp. HCB117 TaxID=3394359 RepID=UPI0039B58DFF